MEEKDKKKESIDDILSDLNGLLNRMPSILDGIKMPELKPVVYESSANQQKTEMPAEESAFSSQEPEQPDQAGIKPELHEPAAQKPDAFLYSTTDTEPETPAPQIPGEYVLSVEETGQEKNNPLPEEQGTGAEAPESGLGDADLEAKPIGLPAPMEFTPEESADISDDGEIAGLDKSINKENDDISALPLPLPQPLPVVEEQAEVVPPQPLESDEAGQTDVGAAGSENPMSQDTEKAAPDPVSGEPVVALAGTVEKSNPAYGATMDFGIPDIDALFKISQGESLAPDAPDAVSLPDTGVEQLKADSSGDEKMEHEPETFPGEEVVSMPLSEEKPEAGDGEKEEPQGETLKLDPVEAEIQGLVLSDSAVPEDSPANIFGQAELESAAVSPAAESADEIVTLSDEDKTLVVAPADGGAEQNIPGSGGLELEPVSAVYSTEPVADAVVPPVDGGLSIELPSSAVSDQNTSEEDKTLVVAPAVDGAEQPALGAVGLELEPASAVSPAEPVADTAVPPADGGLSVGQPSVAVSDKQSSEDDKTVVIAPSAAAGEDEHTVIYEPGANTVSTRTPSRDFGTLSETQPPAVVLQERIRNVAFLYWAGEESLMASILFELDAICLKSETKPMFVRRAFVKVLEQDINPNFVLQSVSDSKAAGLVCAGNIPQEKISELENVFSPSGILFRHLNAENFTHSSALDLVVELIMRN
ncbi:MAG TPA: hypothetical protein DCL44_02360 [Elusimicrobia bacterium]|nr:hypothetical protein [Elusimicrobiota bacterium]